MMESLVPEFDVFGFVRERTGNVMPGITPSNTYTTRDGKHVIIGANGDAIFRRFMQAIGRDDLANDPSLADNAGRDVRSSELYSLISQWVSVHDLTEVLAVTTEAGVPASRIFSVEDMFEDPQYLARQMLEWAVLPDGRKVRMPGVVPKLGETPGCTETLGPELGEHTDATLAELGYSAEKIAELHRLGAI
jgi:formyl-CoA transferase